MSLESSDGHKPYTLPATPSSCGDQKPLRVAATSQPAKVAGAIAGQVREFGCAEIHAVGADAVNQTVKSVALSKSYLVNDNIQLDIDFDFMNIEINGAIRNGMRFCVRDKARLAAVS